jgi:hypothetical protein
MLQNPPLGSTADPPRTARTYRSELFHQCGRRRTTVAPPRPAPLLSSAVAATGARREGAAGIPSPSSPACPLPGKGGRRALHRGMFARVPCASGRRWFVRSIDRWKGAAHKFGRRGRTRSSCSDRVRISLAVVQGRGDLWIPARLLHRSIEGRVGTSGVASSDARCRQSHEDATRSKFAYEQEQADLSAAGLANSRCC